MKEYGVNGSVYVFSLSSKADGGYRTSTILSQEVTSHNHSLIEGLLLIVNTLYSGPTCTTNRKPKHRDWVTLAAELPRLDEESSRSAAGPQK